MGSILAQPDDLNAEITPYKVLKLGTSVSNVS